MVIVLPCEKGGARGFNRPVASRLGSWDEVCALVERVRAAEVQLGKGQRLTQAVARYYAKLLAIKDEYEVARLHTDPAFREKIANMFEGDIKLKFHLAPPLLSRPGPDGRAKKIAALVAIASERRDVLAAAFDALGIVTQDRHAPPESGTVARSASAPTSCVTGTGGSTSRCRTSPRVASP